MRFILTKICLTNSPSKEKSNKEKCNCNYDEKGKRGK
jgi:hypothetical protein